VGETLQERFMKTQQPGVVPGMPDYIDWLEERLKQADERGRELEKGLARIHSDASSICCTACGTCDCGDCFYCFCDGLVDKIDALLKGE